jgi:hypothetical protein
MFRADKWSGGDNLREGAGAVIAFAGMSGGYAASLISFMPFTFQDAQRHRIPKTQHCVPNWPDDARGQRSCIGPSSVLSNTHALF